MFKAYGTPLLTIDEEKNLVKSWNPQIQYRDLQFKRVVKVVNGDVVEDKGTTNYTNTLSITIPTTVIANPVNSGIAPTMIGNKLVNIGVADTSNGVATASEIESAVLNAVKTDSSILALYSASDINISSGKIVATKIITTDPTNSVSAINAVFGANSVTTTSVTTKTGVEVGFVPNNKIFTVDETLAEKFEIDVDTIQPSLLNSVLPTKEIYAQALAEVFRVVIKDAVKAKLEDLRSRINNFEGEVEEIL
jgi:hypothetical protein